MIQSLHPVQIEAYRHILYEQKKIEQEFWVEFVHQALSGGIKALSNMIVYKMGVLLNGGDLTEAMGLGGDDNAPPQSAAFFESLGLSENDISLLKKEGVDLSSLTVSRYEQVDGSNQRK